MINKKLLVVCLTPFVFGMNMGFSAESTTNAGEQLTQIPENGQNTSEPQQPNTEAGAGSNEQSSDPDVEFKQGDLINSLFNTNIPPQGNSQTTTANPHENISQPVESVQNDITPEENGDYMRSLFDENPAVNNESTTPVNPVAEPQVPVATEHGTLNPVVESNNEPAAPMNPVAESQATANIADGKAIKRLFDEGSAANNEAAAPVNPIAESQVPVTTEQGTVNPVIESNNGPTTSVNPVAEPQAPVATEQGTVNPVIESTPAITVSSDVPQGDDLKSATEQPSVIQSDIEKAAEHIKNEAEEKIEKKTEVVHPVVDSDLKNAVTDTANKLNAVDAGIDEANKKADETSEQVSNLVLMLDARLGNMENKLEKLESQKNSDQANPASIQEKNLQKDVVVLDTDNKVDTSKEISHEFNKSAENISSSQVVMNEKDMEQVASSENISQVKNNLDLGNVNATKPVLSESSLQQSPVVTENSPVLDVENSITPEENGDYMRMLFDENPTVSNKLTTSVNPVAEAQTSVVAEQTPVVATTQDVPNNGAPVVVPVAEPQAPVAIESAPVVATTQNEANNGTAGGTPVTEQQVPVATESAPVVATTQDVPNNGAPVVVPVAEPQAPVIAEQTPVISQSSIVTSVTPELTPELRAYIDRQVENSVNENLGSLQKMANKDAKVDNTPLKVEQSSYEKEKIDSDKSIVSANSIDKSGDLKGESQTSVKSDENTSKSEKLSKNGTTDEDLKVSKNIKEKSVVTDSETATEVDEPKTSDAVSDEDTEKQLDQSELVDKKEVQKDEVQETKNSQENVENALNENQSEQGDISSVNEKSAEKTESNIAKEATSSSQVIESEDEVKEEGKLEEDTKVLDEKSETEKDKVSEEQTPESNTEDVANDVKTSEPVSEITQKSSSDENSNEVSTTDAKGGSDSMKENKEISKIEESDPIEASSIETQKSIANLENTNPETIQMFKNTMNQLKDVRKAVQNLNS